MHFEAQMTVRLKQPVSLVEHGKTHSNKATGYLIIVWVNADRFSEAAVLAEETALNPKEADGKRTKYKGYIEEAEIQVVEKNQIPEEILATAGDVDRRGVFASTALMFFEHEEE
jgi:hypothetical protein